MSYFVTGTDTNVGKTLISCGLLYAFGKLDKRVVGMKPIAAGVDASCVQSDVACLMAAGNVVADREWINPYCFISAVAPHLAAQQEGVNIDLGHIVSSFAELQRHADIVVVEGVGGFVVPLNETEDSAMLAIRLGLPVIMVVGMRLGCLSHALLTSGAIASAGLQLGGWVANCVDPNMSLLEENIAALAHRLTAPLLGIVPYSTRPNAAYAGQFIDVHKLAKQHLL